MQGFSKAQLDWQRPAIGLTCAMRLHDRYLFRELLTPLVFCLGGFFVFYISYFFFTELDRMQEHKLNLVDCIEYAAAMTPGFFVMVLPIALLLALLYALTHHARYHELTALRAAGISLWRLCAPYFVVGLVASGIYFLLNEVAAPRGADWSQKILSRHVKVDSKPTEKTRFTKTGFNIHPRRIWQVGECDAARRVMFNLNVTWTLPDGSWQSLQADRAERTNGVWVFYDAKMFAQAGSQGSLMPLFSTNQIAMPEFDESPDQILTSLKFNESEGLLASRGLDISLSDLRSYLRLIPNMPEKQKLKVLTKYYGRLAAPWTCLVVVLIAIPFGAPSGRRNLFFGVAGSIFICFTFFVLQQMSLTFGANGHIPPWLAAWLPNLFFAAAGTVLISRTR
jgi:lipopolysaccharide export system permease protein